MQCVRSMTLYGEFWCDGCYGWAVVMRAQGWMECSLWIFQIHICENNNEMWFSVESWADKYESNTNAVAHTYSTVCLYSIYTSCGSATGRAAIACVCIYNGACGSALDSLVTLQHFRHCNSQTRCVSICEMKLCACSGGWMCVCVCVCAPQIATNKREINGISKHLKILCLHFRLQKFQNFIWAEGRACACVCVGLHDCHIVSFDTIQISVSMWRDMLQVWRRWCGVLAEWLVHISRFMFGVNLMILQVHCAQPNVLQRRSY